MPKVSAHLCPILCGRCRLRAPLCVSLIVLVVVGNCGTLGSPPFSHFLGLSFFSFFPLCFLVNYTSTFKKQMQGTGGIAGVGGEAEAKGISEPQKCTLSLPSCVSVVASGAKKKKKRLEFVSGEKSALSETHWLPEKL